MIVDFSSVNTIYNFLLKDLTLVGKMDALALNFASTSLISRIIARTPSSRKKSINRLLFHRLANSGPNTKPRLSL